MRCIKRDEMLAKEGGSKKEKDELALKKAQTEV